MTKTIELGNGFTGSISEENTPEGRFSWSVAQPPGVNFMTGWAASESEAESKMKAAIVNNDPAPGPSRPKQQMEAAASQAMGDIAPSPFAEFGKETDEGEDSKTKAADQPKEEAEDLNELTVADLKDRARGLELTGFSSMNKAELIDAIETEEKKQAKKK